MRRSNQVREPPKDPFSKFFVSNLWPKPAIDPGSLARVDTGNGGITPEKLDEFSAGESSMGTDLRYADLRKENDNLLCVLDVQSEKIRKLEGKMESGLEASPGSKIGDQVEELAEELIKTEHSNVGLQLDINVLLEKLKEKEREIDLLKIGFVGDAGDITVEKEEGEINAYDEEFPQSVGQDKVETPANPVKSWANANIAAQNRSKDAGHQLSFVEPMEIDGRKVVACTEDDIAEECERWRKAAVVYVLGARSPFCFT